MLEARNHADGVGGAPAKVTPLLATKELKAEEKEQNTPKMTGLAMHAKKQWELYKFAKEPIERQMLDNLRRRKGIYSASKLAEIRKQGGSELFMLLTDVKCRAAEAWIRDVLAPLGDKPWTMEPTPKPDLPLELQQMAAQSLIAMAQMGVPGPDGMPIEAAPMQNLEGLEAELRTLLEGEAQERAERMERLCEDQQTEGGFRQAFNDFITDVVTLKGGILKAPIFRVRDDLKWGPENQPILTKRLRMEFERVDPFNFYPAPGAQDVQNAAGCIERHRLTRRALDALRGVPGYKESAIKYALARFDQGGLHNWLWTDQEVANIHERHSEWLTPDHQIDALQCHFGVKGTLLAEWGLRVSDLTREYECEIWLIGDVVIKAVLNGHPLNKRPYHKCAFVEIPGAFWGRGVPELMIDSQDVCNATARALVNNLAIASGPQVEANTRRFANPDESATDIYPWKVWEVAEDPTGGSQRAINFFQPTSNAQELLGVFDKFREYADDQTGIPAYIYGGGDQTQGAGSTASGLSMLMGSAARGIKSVILNIDLQVIEPMLEQQFIHNMLHHPDPSVKGDIRIKPRGSVAMLLRDATQVRRGEFLANTMNPIDTQIMGPAGRATVLREVAKGLDMPVDKVVPDEDALKKMLGAPPGQPTAFGAPPGQQAIGLDPAGGVAGGRDANQFPQGG